MKVVLNLSRIVVGVLFIFSGLIKANDPLGLSYKMQEFFEVWGLTSLDHLTLAFSVLMIVFEIVAGVAVLLGWKMNLFAWLLLILIVFFSFLTGYAYLSGKVRECGCFGDCIPLQAGQSFAKDLLLLVLILVVFAYRRSIRPLAAPRTAAVILLFAAAFSFAFQRHVLLHLPLVDCLPYRVGSNLMQQMQVPPGMPRDSSVILFTYEKNGKTQQFTADHFPADFDDSYRFIKREDKLVRRGASAAIHDFALQTSSGNDSTTALLTRPGFLALLLVKDGYQPERWQKDVDSVLMVIDRKGVPAFVVTNLPIAEGELNARFPSTKMLRADGTAIKTAARFNPTLFLLKQGTVVGKWSAPDFDRATAVINALP